jgi:benzodiazapine receptor
MNRAGSVLGLLVSVVAVLGVAALSGLSVSRAGPDWYEALSKPSWTPPAWLFGPVWTVLYLMMAAAAWLVWRRHGLVGAAVPLGLFAVQLALNAAWSPVFFGLHAVGWGFAVIVGLWVAVLATMVAFWRVVPAAGWMMVPYQLWITFAGALNLAIWRLNA